MKQTAVDYLFQELWQAPKDKWMWQIILKQAIEMEKQETIKAFNIGNLDGYNYGCNDNIPLYEDGEQYYNETYGKDGDI